MITYEVLRELKPKGCGWEFTGQLYVDGKKADKIKGNVANTTESQIRKDIIERMDRAVAEYEEAHKTPKQLILPKDSIFVDKLK